MKTLQALFRYILDRYSLSLGPSINALVLFAAVLLVLFLIRLIIRRHRIRIARSSLPLVIGGWGTRGKSGLERKKAALFQALGFNVISKTTGCEAMFIHAKPGLDATEIPIYRPGNKATIWEQERIMYWSKRLGAEVFLWECMALAPDYAALMQSDWMRDDYATLSNTFLDHENVQGPTGMDVTRSLSAFIPEHAVLYTAEESMLPVIRQMARRKCTRLVPLPKDIPELIGGDVLDLFPYSVHPENLGLVLKMAEDLGIDRDFALCETARHIRPDLGAFKRYMTSFRNRTLEFWNGMSANDEVSCLNNWRQAGFDRYRPNEPEWIVTVVNNRDDRILRSREFADILVRHTPAHRHILIGTNLNGLQGYILTAFDHYLHQHPLLDDTKCETDPERYEHLEKRLEREVIRLRADAISLQAIAFKLNVMMSSERQPEIWCPEMVEKVLSADKNKRNVLEVLFPEGLECSLELKQAIRNQLIVDLADYRDITALKDALRSFFRECNSSFSLINTMYRKTLTRIFRRRFVRIDDPAVSGDAVIDFLVRLTPPGYKIRIMGMQNIKGTGLDFAYRWISLDKVQKAVSRLHHTDASVRLSAAQFLADHDDYGILDTPLAIQALETALNDPRNNTPELSGILADALHHVAAVRSKQEKARNGDDGKGWRRPLSRAWYHFRRADRSKTGYRQTKRILEDLAANRISHARAAALLRKQVKEQEH